MEREMEGSDEGVVPDHGSVEGDELEGKALDLPVD